VWFCGALCVVLLLIGLDVCKCIESFTVKCLCHMICCTVIGIKTKMLPCQVCRYVILCFCVCMLH